MLFGNWHHGDEEEALPTMANTGPTWVQKVSKCLLNEGLDTVGIVWQLNGSKSEGPWERQQAQPMLRSSPHQPHKKLLRQCHLGVNFVIRQEL